MLKVVYTPKSYEYIAGTYECANGTVYVYSDDLLTSFAYVREGKIYKETLTKHLYSRWGLSIAAAKFAKRTDKSFF